MPLYEAYLLVKKYFLHWNHNYLGLFAGTIEDIRAVAFFSAFFFFFSLFLGLLSPILNTSNHILTQLYSIPEIIAISIQLGLDFIGKTKNVTLVMPLTEFEVHVSAFLAPF
jgi:hypothetical protein